MDFRGAYERGPSLREVLLLTTWGLVMDLRVTKAVSEPRGRWALGLIVTVPVCDDLEDGGAVPPVNLGSTLGGTSFMLSIGPRWLYGPGHFRCHLYLYVYKFTDTKSI